MLEIKSKHWTSTKKKYEDLKSIIQRHLKRNRKGA